MKFVFEVGMRVFCTYRKERVGIITALTEYPDEVCVRWDHVVYSYEHEGDVTLAGEIMPDTPEVHAQLVEKNKQVQAKIDEATSAFELAFQIWRKANALERGIDDGTPDQYEGAYALCANKDLDLSKFKKMINSHGWETSSFFC